MGKSLGILLAVGITAILVDSAIGAGVTVNALKGALFSHNNKESAVAEKYITDFRAAQYSRCNKTGDVESCKKELSLSDQEAVDAVKRLLVLNPQLVAAMEDDLAESIIAVAFIEAQKRKSGAPASRNHR